MKAVEAACFCSKPVSALPEATRSCLSFGGQWEDHGSSWPRPHGSVAEQQPARWGSGLAPGVGGQGLLQGNLQSSAPRAHLGGASTAAVGSVFCSPGSYGLRRSVLVMAPRQHYYRCFCVLAIWLRVLLSSKPGPSSPIIGC